MNVSGPLCISYTFRVQTPTKNSNRFLSFQGHEKLNMTTTIWKTLFGQPDNPDDLRGQATLSEDACGDLIHSLARLGYLPNIANSLDGKSFITHDQLDTDILSLLDKRSGTGQPSVTLGR